MLKHNDVAWGAILSSLTLAFPFFRSLNILRLTVFKATFSLLLIFPAAIQRWSRTAAQYLIASAAQSYWTLFHFPGSGICLSSANRVFYTVKKGYRFSRPPPRCHWPNSPWRGLFPASVIPAAWNGEIAKLFYSVYAKQTFYLLWHPMEIPLS